MVKIDQVELVISYEIGKDRIQFRKSNFEEDLLDLSILDKDPDEKSGETTISFENFKELKDCINDFELKFNNLIKKK